MQINSSKSQLIIFRAPANSDLPDDIIIRNCRIVAVESARNLGVIFDKNLRFDGHVRQIVKCGYAFLRNIRRCRDFISADNLKTVIHSFVTSRIDYCNSLLYGAPKIVLRPLQLLQNSAARCVVGSKRYEHITPTLRDLHWLPINQRIKFKLICLTKRCLDGTAPTYLSTQLHLRKACRETRSSSKQQLMQPLSKKSIQQRRFAAAAATLWNDIPEATKNLPFSTFKNAIKTMLFHEYFNH